MEQMVIIGAGGHGRVAADIAQLNGYGNIVFLDDNRELKKCGPYDVIGEVSRAGELEGPLFIGIGNATVRRQFCGQYRERIITLVHPNAVVASGVGLGTGSVVMAGAVINSGSRVGEGCIVNTSSSIDHDCIVGSYVHIAAGAHLSGNVAIGNGTWIGAGAVVSNNVNVCSGCMIGAGAVVIKDIREPGTYVGVPARKVERNMDKKRRRQDSGGYYLTGKNPCPDSRRDWQHRRVV